MREDPGFDACGVRVARLPGRGFAGVSTRRIEAGARVLAIPRSRMLTASDARSRASPIGAAASALTEWRALMLALLHERRLGDASAFAPWLALLPDQREMELHHPLMWDRETRRRRLQGSPTLRRIERAKVRCAEDRDAVRAALRDARDAEEEEEEGDPEGDWPSLDDALWAAAILSSRAFRLDSRAFELDEESTEGSEAAAERFEWAYVSDASSDDDAWAWDPAEAALDADDPDAFFPESNLEGADRDDHLHRQDHHHSEESEEEEEEDDPGGSFLALVPWADSLNHSPAAGRGAVLTYDPISRVASAFAHREYASAGLEVFDSYGPGLTRSESLASYGFVADSPSGEASGEASEPEEASCDLPGEWFWRVADRAEEDASDERSDASGALRMLRREEAAAGASHRDALRAVLAACGLGPGDATIRVFERSGIGASAAAWCRLATTNRAAFHRAGWDGGRVDPVDVAGCHRVVAALTAMDDATWGRAKEKKPVEKPVEGGFGEDAGGVDADVDVTGAEREARARATLARLVAEVLEGYPVEAKKTRGGGGGGEGRAEEGGGTRDGEEGAGLVGEEAAAALLASEARALRGALERLVVGS